MKCNVQFDLSGIFAIFSTLYSDIEKLFAVSIMEKLFVNHGDKAAKCIECEVFWSLWSLSHMLRGIDPWV